VTESHGRFNHPRVIFLSLPKTDIGLRLGVCKAEMEEMED